jgi:hypothetical protein
LRALAKPPALRFGTTRELQDSLLDAGASRRGRGVVPVWSELPSAAASGEASTQPGHNLLAEHALGAKTAALDGAIDAALAEASVAVPSALPPRVGAHTTLVIDDVPFAAHARVLGSEPSGPARTAALLWVAGLCAALALALGAVRLSRRAEEPAPAASTLVAAPAPAALRAPLAPATVSPRPEAPEPSPRRSAAAELDAERGRERKPARPDKQRAAGRAPAAQEESGWVIRR